MIKPELISEGIYEQGILLLQGMLAGVVVWFLYDVLRLWRRIMPHGTLWIAIEDVVFFFVCAMVGFQLLYPWSLGQLRVFLVLAFFVGTICYHKLVSPYFVGAGAWLIHRIKRLFSSKTKKKKEK